jgi:UDP-N-acetylmuramoyl-tripeptide--D-alanyl-D-alanine ligase
MAGPEVSTDTRSLRPGAVFFALRGERHDGHGFVPDALAAGASAVIVEEWQGVTPDGAAVIRVEDTLGALQRLACWYRSRLDLPVVAVTGSNGKTSTKDFTASVLSQRFRVSATKGNLNNHIGLPLTVLSTGAEHTAAVWEMGMNHVGELAPLCEIARPKIGIITNIGTAHIEYMGTRETIAEEKGALARSLPADGTLLVSAGCEFYEYFRQRTHARIVPVGNGRGVVRAEEIRISASCSEFVLVIEGCDPVAVRIGVSGRHMITNALLAAAAGWTLGLAPEEIARGLSDAVLTGGRLRRFEWNGITILDDTYNANPESMAAAIEALAEIPVTGRRIAVLGRMAELGVYATSAHHRIGKLAAERGIQVISVGVGAEGISEGAGSSRHFADTLAAAEAVAAMSASGDAVLFKGSRTAAVEKVMQSAFPHLT